MSQFISKLQYKNYEKGEFINEASRDLAATIQLINNFPWLEQRGVDVEPTGPSVTIQDGSLNYLKIGLYFNNKFCIYYFDSSNHFYEYHADSLEIVKSVVSDFFKNDLKLNLFEKHFFSIGSKQHFVSDDFEYRSSTTQFFIYLTVSILYFVFFFGYMAITNLLALHFNITSTALFFIPGLIALYCVFYTFKNRNTNRYLQLSKGKNEFRFGVDEQHIITYDKNNITEIVCYEGILSSNRPTSLKKFQIIFKDKQTIEFNSWLIPLHQFLGKFIPDLNIPVTYKWKSLF